MTRHQRKIESAIVTTFVSKSFKNICPKNQFEKENLNQKQKILNLVEDHLFRQTTSHRMKRITNNVFVKYTQRD